MMMALHIWALSHGIASLFGRGDAAQPQRCRCSREELLEAGVLLYLRGLGQCPDVGQQAEPSLNLAVILTGRAGPI